jgi:hypothetical protein
MESTIRIEINKTTKQVRVVDISDYNFPVTTLLAKGLGTLRFEGNIVAERLSVSSPLINLEGGATASAWFNCILDSNGAIAYGTYSIDNYSVRTALVDDLVNSVVAGTGGAGGFVLNGIDLSDVLVDGDSVTISDSLSLNNGVKSVASVSVVSGNSTVFVDQAVNAETPVASSKISFDLTKQSGSASGTYSGCEEIELEYTFEADCDRGTNGTLIVRDTTDYEGQTVNTKELTLAYPSWAATADVVSTNGVISLSAIATGTYTTTLDANVSMTSGDLIVTYDVTKSDENKLTCSGTLCGLLPCIKNLMNVHLAALKGGRVSPYQFFVDGVLLNYLQALEYKKCGEFEKYQDNVQAIDDLLDASGCECSCCDNDELVWVLNISPSDDNVITELQAAVEALALVDVTLEENINLVQENVDNIDERLVLNSLIYTNSERITGSVLWGELVFNVPTSLFVSGGQPRSLGCLDIEITGSTADTADEIHLRNETTASSLIASFLTSGDKFKVLIRLVCSSPNVVKAAVDLMYLNGSSVYVGSDTPTYATVDWDFDEPVNQLKLSCDNVDLNFIDQIKVTTHKNA